MKKGIVLSIALSSILFANNIEAGYGNYFITDANGTSYSWGNNVYGDLGNGNDWSNGALPTKLDTNISFIDISSLYEHSLALSKDGKVYAWGYNYYGQLGDGTTTNKNTPEKIDINDDIIQIAAGGGHSLALSKNGDVYAWGKNYSGQLGDGTTSSKKLPEKININDNIIQIAAGSNHSLALSKNGDVYAWGANYSGQLGDGTTSGKKLPEKININDNIIQIAAGNDYSLALSKDGKVYAWGYNHYGQLGDGTTTSKSTPEIVDINDTIVKISAGAYHSLALSKDGKVYAWGYNCYGQLGDGTYSDKTKPVEIKFPAKIVDIDAGEYSSIAIDENGAVYVWGYYAYKNSAYNNKPINVYFVKKDDIDYNLSVNLNNPIVGYYNYSDDKESNGEVNVTLEANGTVYSLNNDFINLGILNGSYYTPSYSYYSWWGYSSDYTFEYNNNTIYPYKDYIALLEINSSMLSDKDFIDSYVLLNTSSVDSLSDTAKDLNTSQQISPNATYSGTMSYDEDVKDSDFTWLKIVKTQNDKNVTSYTKYKFVIDGEKIKGDDNASITLQFYSEKDIDFQVVGGDYVYKNSYGDYYYIDEEGNSYYLDKDDDGNYYYYSYGYQTVCYDYGCYDDYVSTKINVDVDKKLLKEGYYTDGENQYYVDSDGYKYYLYFSDNKGEYYYYDNNGKKQYITSDPEPIGEKTYKLKKLLMTDLVVDNTKNYYIKLLVNKDVSDYKFKLALIKDDTYYNSKLTLNDNGSGYVDLVIPKSKTYRLILNSDNKFDANLTDYENDAKVKKVLINNEYTYKKDLGLKAGLYSIYFKGEPNSVVKYMLIDSKNEIEQEPDDTIDLATKYIPDKSIRGNIDNSDDIDFYAFNLGNSDYWWWYDYNDETYTVNVTLQIDRNLTADDEIALYLYNSNDPVYAIISKKLYNDDFDEDGNAAVSFKGNLNAGVYYLKVKYKDGSSYPLNYTLTIDGSIKNMPVTKRELLYTNQYYKFIANNILDLDKIKEDQNSTQASGDRGEAIILAGIGDEPTDSLFNPTQSLAYNMYKVFKARGFSDKDITFMDSYTDADGDGKVDDFNDDSNVSVNDFYNAIENAKKSTKTGPLYIYMVDHGTNYAFKISDNDVDGDGNPEIVYAKDLAAKLDDFQQATGRKVVLIIEACKSGSFIDKLQSTIYDRVVVTSSKKGEISFIDPSGVSFTKFLQDNLLAGRNIDEAYKVAKNTLYKASPIYKNQHPQLYKTNDEVANIVIGGNFAAAGMELTNITDYYGKDGNETIDLSNTDKLDLYAVVKSASPIKNVYATVIPPNFNPDVNDSNFSTPDLSKYKVDLVYNKNNDRYEGSFDLTDYKYNGTFSVSYVAEDSDGNVVTKSAEINATGGKDYNGTSYIKNVLNNTSVNVTKIDKNTLHIYNGWNMIGALKDIDVNNVPTMYSKLFTMSNMIAWKWDNSNKDWNVYTTMSISTKYSTIDYIYKGEGFWLKASNNVDINISNVDDSELSSNYSNGWNLIAITKNDENASDVLSQTNGNILWQYDVNTNKWKVYSNDDELKVLLQSYINKGIFENVDKLQKGSAVWVYIK